MLEQKAVFIEEVRKLLPDRMDRAISEIVTANASRVERLPVEELRKMKSALALKKDKAVEKGVLALESADWLWRVQSGIEDGRDPIVFFGVNEAGAIWQSLPNYSKEMGAIFKAYGLQVEEPLGTYSHSRFRVGLPKTYQGKKEELQEINEAVGKAHREYCDSKYKVSSLEGQLKEAIALEKYESV